MKVIADVDYPAYLPNPLRENHSLRPAPTFDRTEVAGGRSINRRGPDIAPTFGVFSYLFKTGVDAAAFEAWYRDALGNGVKWFNTERKTPLGMTPVVCRFTDVYTGPTLVGVDFWRFDCPMEIWERPLMKEGWGLFPEFLEFAGLFDIAMNREWPEAKE